MFIICQTSIINMAKVCIGNSYGRKAPDARRELGLSGMGLGVVLYVCMCVKGKRLFVCFQFVSVFSDLFILRCKFFNFQFWFCV